MAAASSPTPRAPLDADLPPRRLPSTSAWPDHGPVLRDAAPKLEAFVTFMG